VHCKAPQPFGDPQGRKPGFRPFFLQPLAGPETAFWEVGAVRSVVTWAHRGHLIHLKDVAIMHFSAGKNTWTYMPQRIQLIWPVFPCSSGVPFPSVSTIGSLLQAAFRSASICSCRDRVQGA